MNRRLAGAQAEQRAADYLLEQRYAVLERNWRCRTGELDIIAAHRTTLIVVEVRSGRGGRFGHPLESVDGRKQLQVRRTAALYVQKTNRHHMNVRFDVIAILLDASGQCAELRHIQHAF